MSGPFDLMDLVPQLTGWQEGKGALYRRLADALRRAMNAGAIPQGVRLPAERVLAEALGVSRTTVVKAYDLLRDQSMLRSHRGSGTFVRHASQGGMPPDSRDPRSAMLSSLFRFREDPAVIDLSLACIAGLDGLPLDLLSLSDADYGTPAAQRGYAPLGFEPLRGAVAERFESLDLATRPTQILITSGAQQAIALTATALVHPGEAVVIESPTYPGAIDAFAKAGARLIPIAVDDEGLRADLLGEVIARTRPCLLYLQPTFHNPTGLVMSEERRRAVARLCDEADVVVLEDYTLGDLRLGRGDGAGFGDVRGARQIAQFMKTAPSIVVGSASKLFWCGLRVGWVRADETMVTRLAQAKITADLGTSLPSQLATLKLMSRYDELVRIRTAQLTPRAELTARILRELLPEWDWAMPRGGLTFWARLPHGDGTELAQIAVRHGVSVVPGHAASPDKSHDRWIRVAFGVESALLEQGLKRLAQAWASYTPQTGVHPPLAVCV